jgi:hypothetical protein
MHIIILIIFIIPIDRPLLCSSMKPLVRVAINKIHKLPASKKGIIINYQNLSWGIHALLRSIMMDAVTRKNPACIEQATTDHASHVIVITKFSLRQPQLHDKEGEISGTCPKITNYINLETTQLCSPPPLFPNKMSHHQIKCWASP